MFAKRCSILRTSGIRKRRHKDPSCIVIVVSHCHNTNRDYYDWFALLSLLTVVTFSASDVSMPKHQCDSIDLGFVEGNIHVRQ